MDSFEHGSELSVSIEIGEFFFFDRSEELLPSQKDCAAWSWLIVYTTLTTTSRAFFLLHVIFDCFCSALLTLCQLLSLSQLCMSIVTIVDQFSR